ncbi:hypothetical protein BGZ58_009932 [Dissophora ornata]|nr:hypothetical protein BGZ58_009932 [Dissophora ornata]
MLNLDAGTIKRKIDSNEYDDETIQEIQPNGKRTCSPMNHTQQFATFGSSSRLSTPQTPNGPEQPNGLGSGWPQSNPSPLLRTAVTSNTQFSMPSNGFTVNGYQTPESVQSSVAVSPFVSMDMDMESASASQSTPAMVQNTNAMLNSAITAQEPNQNNSALMPSALLAQANGSSSSSEYVPVHGRSMEIPSYARVPLNEAQKYRDQRWSSCIYGTDTRIGQGMMI